MQKKSKKKKKKILHALQKANMRAFFAKQKISLILPYLRKASRYQTCSKWTCYVAGYLTFTNPLVETADVPYGQI